MAEKSRWQCVKACTWNKKYWAYMSVYEGTATPPAQFFTLLGPVEEEPETGGGTGCGCGCGGLTEAQVRAIAREEMPHVPELATETEFDEMLRVVGLL